MTCTTTCVRPSPSQAHCSVCHVTWSGITGFDRHRIDDQCRTPAEIGYVDDGRGVFRAPMTDERRQQLAALRTNADSRRGATPGTAETGPEVPRPTPADSEAAETISVGWEDA